MIETPRNEPTRNADNPYLWSHWHDKFGQEIRSGSVVAVWNAAGIDDRLFQVSAVMAHYGGLPCLANDGNGNNVQTAFLRGRWAGDRYLKSVLAYPERTVVVDSALYIDSALSDADEGN